jgi:putative membrane protein
MFCHLGLGLGGLFVCIIGFFLFIMFIMMVARLAMGSRHVYWMHSNGMRRYGTAEADPLEIAKERYAKGEITKEQFEQIKKDIA